MGRNSCLIVAEVGTNWVPGDLDSAREMVRVAAEAGADLVKFQDWHPLKQMNRPQAWKERCAPWTLPPEWHGPLRAEANMHGLGFMCSVFTPDALDRALAVPAIVYQKDAWGVEYFARDTAVKLASSEVSNHALLARLANRTPWLLDDGAPHPPVYLSLGEVAHASQVYTAVARLGRYDLTLMACVAEYPVRNPLNLLDSLTFAQTFGLPAGVSSHVAADRAAWVAGQAVKRGAVVMEAHLRSESTPQNCPDWGTWSLFPDQFRDIVKAIRNAE